MVEEGGVHSPKHLAFTVAILSPTPAEPEGCSNARRRATAGPKPGREEGLQGKEGHFPCGTS